MNTPPKDAEVQQCHSLYSEYVNFRMPLSFTVRLQWEQFLHAGFTLDDLRLVLRRWRTKIDMKGCDPGVLRLSRLTNPDTFGEDLALAHAEKRKPAPTPRDKALEQLRPTACEPLAPDKVKSGREAAIRALQACAKNLEQS